MSHSAGIAIIDSGRSTGKNLAMSLRSEGYYADLFPCLPDHLPEEARGIIVLSDKCDEPLDTRFFDTGLPILALGLASASLLAAKGGKISWLRTINENVRVHFSSDPVFDGLDFSDRHIEKLPVITCPDGFEPIGFCSEDDSPVAFADSTGTLYAILFDPEANDPDATAILNSFCGRICRLEANWSYKSVIDDIVRKIQDEVGDGTVSLTITGGVDSAVCTAIMHKAIGPRLRCLFVDTGLMRKGEPERVRKIFEEQMGISLTCIDASEQIFEALHGITDMTRKREAVNEILSRLYESRTAHMEKTDFVANGTIYDDRLSASFSPSPHVITPLMDLFKPEVRYIGELLGLPGDILHKPPFPEAGLAVRCMGEATPYRLQLLRDADAILREEMIQSGQDKRVSQFFALLTDIKTRCAPPEDGRAGYAVVLRAITSHGTSHRNASRLPYDLLERVSSRISQEIKGINRVLYEISECPPATTEWE